MTNRIVIQHEDLPAQAVIDALIATREAMNVAISGFEALDQPIFEAERTRLAALSDFMDAEEDEPNTKAGDASIAATREKAVAARDAVLALTPQCLKGHSVIRKARRAEIDPLAAAMERRASNRLIAAKDPAALADLIARRDALDAHPDVIRRRNLAAQRAA